LKEINYLKAVSLLNDGELTVHRCERVVFAVDFHRLAGQALR